MFGYYMYSSWDAKLQTEILLLYIPRVLVSCCVHEGFTVLGPNCKLKLDGLKSIPPWHAFQVWTDWKPSGFWIWPSLEEVYEINSQSTAGLCLLLCYMLMMPSNSIWENRTFCKPELKSDWVKLPPNFCFPLLFIHCPSWKLTPERTPCVNINIYYFSCGGKFILITGILGRLQIVLLTYSEYPKVTLKERSAFSQKICTEKFSSKRPDS